MSNVFEDLDRGFDYPKPGKRENVMPDSVMPSSVIPSSSGGRFRKPEKTSGQKKIAKKKREEFFKKAASAGKKAGSFFNRPSKGLYFKKSSGRVF